MSGGIQHEADRGRERGIADVVGEPADTDRRTAPDGQVENLLGDLGHAFELRPSACQHQAGVE